jgi:membrane protease YdiL (CAAX protease family)
MEIFHTHEARNNFLNLLLKIIVALAGIHFLRVAFSFGLSTLIQPVGILLQFLNCLVFIILGTILLIYFKPSLNDLGLEYANIRMKTRIIYIIGFSVLFTLILGQYVSQWEVHVLIFSLVVGIITPVFEELVFRGYIWNKLHESEGIINPDFLTLDSYPTFRGVAIGIYRCIHPKPSDYWQCRDVNNSENGDGSGFRTHCRFVTL